MCPVHQREEDEEEVELHRTRHRRGHKAAKLQGRNSTTIFSGSHNRGLQIGSNRNGTINFNSKSTEVFVSLGNSQSISKLIEQAVLELKKTRLPIFECCDLLTELEILNRALTQLQHLEPTQQEQNLLEGIRALATTCHKPLEVFVGKIKEHQANLESVDGSDIDDANSRSSQWSFDYREEVQGLRASLAPTITTITLLLLTQTTGTLSKADSDRLENTRQLTRILSKQEDSLHELKAKTENFMTTHGHHLRCQDNILEDIQSKGTAIHSQIQETHATTVTIHRNVKRTQASTSSLLKIGLEIMRKVTVGVSALREITRMMTSLVGITTKFTTEMKDTVNKLLRVFNEIQIRLAQLERIIPKGMSLPIVVFFDAFNEPRALPYDMCQQWETFHGLLTVIFANRQGLERVNKGQFVITSTRLGRIIDRIFWKHSIQPGDELSMAMIVDQKIQPEDFCPFESCRASIKHVKLQRGGKICPKCCRFAVLSPLTLMDMQPVTEDTESRRYILELLDQDQSLSSPTFEDIEFYHSILLMHPIYLYQ